MSYAASGTQLQLPLLFVSLLIVAIFLLVVQIVLFLTVLILTVGEFLFFPVTQLAFLVLPFFLLLRQFLRIRREQEQRIPGAQLSFLHQPERLAFLPTVRKLRKAFRDDSAAPAAAAGQSAHGLSEFGHPSPYLLLRSSA